MLATALRTASSSTRHPPKWATLLLISSMLLSAWGCSAVTETAQIRSDQSTPPPRSADELLVVDCLLPGQIRKLGRSMTYLTPGRPVKTSAQDCEIRGGEYVAYDRSNYATALKVWLPLANEGDKVAQTYVGEIYEKGLGVQPDYALAIEWYRKAAEQGYTRAQINLGYLYEQGLGIGKDPAAALNWYRKAAGLSNAIAIEPVSINTEGRKELEELRREVERRKDESDSLRQQLGQAQEQLQLTQQELERRKGKAQTERQQLEKALQELERRKKQAEAVRDDAEIRRLEEQLKQRQADLKRQQQEITGLHQKISQLETEAQRYGQQLDKLKKDQVALAGPTIEMINPQLMTRGIPSIKTRPGIEHVIVGRVTAPTGLLTFTVNNREEKLDEKGLFRVPIPIQRSSVPVTVVAIDKQGKRATVELLLKPEEGPSEAKAPQPPSLPVAEKKPVLPTVDFGGNYALIIGNKEYTHWPNLDTPKNDAVKTAEVLSRKYGFKTKVLLNATRYDILLALYESQKKLTEKENLLIYYAGHGHLDDKGRGYWIPVDGEIDKKNNWISTLEITTMLDTILARHVLVVADTCYAGALTQSALIRLEGSTSDEDRYNRLKIIAEKRSRTILTSGDLKPVLDRGGGEHSIFAKAFLNILGENNEILEGQRVYQEVSARVAYAASAVRTDLGPVEQVPRYAPIKHAGHEGGDFLFIPSAK
jgi:hypothetical protein